MGGDRELQFMITVGLIIMILLSSESKKEFWGYVIGFFGFVLGILLMMYCIGAT